MEITFGFEVYKVANAQVYVYMRTCIYIYIWMSGVLTLKGSYVAAGGKIYLSMHGVPI